MWDGLQSEQKAVPKITWTKDLFCGIYVHFKCSSLNTWGRSALCTLHPSSFSPFICISLSVTTTDSPGILRPPLPWLVWPKPPWHITFLDFSHSIPQQGYLTIRVRRRKTRQTSQLRQHTPSQGRQEKTPCCLGLGGSVDICVWV